MVKVEEQGRPKYSKFDNLDTPVLEAILRADFDALEAEQMDVETVIYISNLLAERRKPPRMDNETAKAEFYEYYYPMVGDEKSIYDFDDEDDDNFELEPETDKRKTASKTDNAVPFRKRLWRKFASAVAVVILLVFGGTVTAYALGYDPVGGFIGRWNDEQFWFEPNTVTRELADLVADYAGETKLVPEWLPEGYVYVSQELSELPAFTYIGAHFNKDTDNDGADIYIDYKFPLNNKNTSLYEKDKTTVEEYECYGVTYYIIEDIGIKTIVWRNDIYEGSISGTFSLAEAKQIINSIYGE